MKFAICNELFEGWSLDRICETIAALGYDGVELAPFTLGERPTELSRAERQALSGAARSRGIEVVGLHWLLAGTQGLHLTSPDRAVRARTRDCLVGLTDFCADLGGSVLVFGSPAQRSLPEGVPPDRAFEYAADVFRGVTPRARERGVTLCIEPLARRETDFINTREEATRLIEAVDDPHFRLHLDVKAMSAEEPSVPEAIRAGAPHLAYFHANDATGAGPGLGDTDFRPIAAALGEIDYAGWVSVEVFDFRPDPETVARVSIEALRAAFCS